MAVKVVDKARENLVSRGVSAADGAVDTQRVFDDVWMTWCADQVDPFIPTCGRLYSCAWIGQVPVKDDTGHTLNDGSPITNPPPVDPPYFPGGSIIPPSGIAPDWSTDYTSGALPADHTFSRASTATYVGRDGLVKYAVVDEPRFEYDADGNALGLLIEPAGENLLLHSSDLTLPSWTTISADTGIAPVPEHGYDDPAGGKSATRIKLERAGAGYSGIQQSSELLGDAEGAASCWVKSADGSTCTIGFRLAGEAAAEFEVTDQWQRIDITQPTTSNWQLLTRDSYAGTSLVCDFLVWGGQLETGTVATSHIPTVSTTKTRAADICTADISALQVTESGPELVTNGGFDTDLTEWDDGHDATYGLFTSTGSKLRIELTGSGGVTRYPRKVQNLGLTVGANYRVTVTGVTKAASVFMFIEGCGSDGIGGTVYYKGGDFTADFVATTGYISLGMSDSVDGTYVEVDNITVKEVTAGLAVQGTVFAEFSHLANGAGAIWYPYAVMDEASSFRYSSWWSNTSTKLRSASDVDTDADDYEVTHDNADLMRLADTREVGQVSRAAINGKSPVAGPNASTVGGGEIIGIGSERNGEHLLTGHMKRIQIWGVALDNTDLQAITAESVAP